MVRLVFTRFRTRLKINSRKHLVPLCESCFYNAIMISPQINAREVQNAKLVTGCKSCELRHRDMGAFPWGITVLPLRVNVLGVQKLFHPLLLFCQSHRVSVTHDARMLALDMLWKAIVNYSRFQQYYVTHKDLH